MSEEKKTKKPSKKTEEKIEEKQEASPGDRGEVGVATAALTIKQRWHEETHLLQDVGDKHNPKKQRWVKKAGTPSLKQFSRALLASGDKLAKDWFAHKKGSLNAKRSDKNVARIAAEKIASKAARRKKSQGKQGKAASTDAAATATAAATKGKK